jgi:formamidopyrimidine-DNA glycosylase
MMPELPEIETLRRSLARAVAGRTIRGAAVGRKPLRMRVSGAALRARVTGRRVEEVARRSKYLWLHLDDESVVVVHLGMSGRLVKVAASAPLEPHTHVRLPLDDGTELRFRDPRRFGMLFVVRRSELDTHPRFAELGPEPFAAEFDWQMLRQRARNSRRAIKNVLMDASVVVGVGNIYACESLHRARIHPTTPALRLSPARWQALHASVLEVLRDAVDAGGTTLQDFRDADGRDGAFQQRLRVYDRAGEDCRRCGRRIRRIVQGGRSTFYCPGCQR